jgi:CheY-like chemotaxis protein
MILRTCLLVSDDPDDHLEFSEALYEISSDTILMTVADANKALELLTMKRHVPDYILLDLAMNGINTDAFLEALHSDPELDNITVIAYGEYADFGKVKTPGISVFLNSGFTYSDLRNFLSKIVNP